MWTQPSQPRPKPRVVRPEGRSDRGSHGKGSDHAGKEKGKPQVKPKAKAKAKEEKEEQEEGGVEELQPPQKKLQQEVLRSRLNV